MRLTDIQRIARTFHQADLHDPPSSDHARARAIIEPVTIRGRTNEAGVKAPDHLALFITHDLWAVWRPLPPLDAKQREDAVRELTRMAPELGAEAKQSLREWVQEARDHREAA